MYKAVTVFALTVAIQGCQPSEASFEDCIFNRMDGVDSDQAARSIHMACREKYPEPENPFAKYHQ